MPAWVCLEAAWAPGPATWPLQSNLEDILMCGQSHQGTTVSVSCQCNAHFSAWHQLTQRAVEGGELTDDLNPTANNPTTSNN